MTKLTQGTVHQLLDYNPETGELKWKVSRGSRKVGGVAGTASNGYLVVRVNGKLYRNHRIIWLWVYGYFPENQIDHINRIRSDNRIDNLREVSQTCNNRNCGMSSNNKSGVTGIHWFTRCSTWQSFIMVDYKRKHLGYHKDLTEAVAHRLAAEQCLDWSGCDSSSSAYQYMQDYLKALEEV